jgi:hypothetical protein
VRPDIRKIILPNLDALVVKKDGLTQTIITDYTINFATYGLITPTTSWGSSLVTWSAGNANTPGFFTPMRFADDNVDFSAVAKGITKVQPFKLIEVLG